jgi:DNA-binding response OmpR family regulator
MSQLDKDHIWIVEDDEGCRFVYDQILKKTFEPIYFPTISSFKSHIDKSVKKQPVLIIADLNLPDGNFLDYLSTYKKSDLGFDTPIIIISSDDDADSLRLCFKNGVDDYLTKPFRRNELIVKIETILRGKNTFGGTIQHDVSIDGNSIEGLTTKERKLLELFLKDGDRKTCREEILDKVWGGRYIHPKSVDVHLYNLRRKLHPYGHIIKSLGQGRWSLISDRL